MSWLQQDSHDHEGTPCVPSHSWLRRPVLPRQGVEADGSISRMPAGPARAHGMRGGVGGTQRAGPGYRAKLHHHALWDALSGMVGHGQAC